MIHIFRLPSFVTLQGIKSFFLGKMVLKMKKIVLSLELGIES